MDSILEESNKIELKRFFLALLKSYFVLSIGFAFIFFCVNFLMRNYLEVRAGFDLITVNIVIGVLYLFYAIAIYLRWNMYSYFAEPGIIHLSIGVLKKRKEKFKVDSSHILSIKQHGMQKMFKVGDIIYYDKEQDLLLEINDVLNPYIVKNHILKSMPEGAGEFEYEDLEEAEFIRKVPDQPKHATYLPEVDEYLGVPEEDEDLLEYAGLPIEVIEEVFEPQLEDISDEPDTTSPNYDAFNEEEIIEVEEIVVNEEILIEERILEITLDNPYSDNSSENKEKNTSKNYNGEFNLDK